MTSARESHGYVPWQTNISGLDRVEWTKLVSSLPSSPFSGILLPPRIVRLSDALVPRNTGAWRQNKSAIASVVET